jgi:hypothetical protein
MEGRIFMYECYIKYVVRFMLSRQLIACISAANALLTVRVST